MPLAIYNSISLIDRLSITSKTKILYKQKDLPKVDGSSGPHCLDQPYNLNCDRVLQLLPNVLNFLLVFLHLIAMWLLQQCIHNYYSHETMENDPKTPSHLYLLHLLPQYSISKVFLGSIMPIIIFSNQACFSNFYPLPLFCFCLYVCVHICVFPCK